MSAADAADMLNVSQRRVRQLLEEGELEGSRSVGNVWLVNPASVERRLRHEPARGRPYEPHRVWSLALLADSLVDDMVRSLSHGEPGSSARASAHARNLADAVHAISGVDPWEVADDPALQRHLQRSLRAALSAVQRMRLSDPLDEDRVHRAVAMEERAHYSAGAMPERQPALRISPEDRAPLQEVGSLRNAIAHAGDLSPKDLYRFRSRSKNVHAFYAHPSVLPGLRDDPLVVMSGAHAAAFYGADLVPGDSVEGYVNESLVDGLCNKYALEPIPLADQAPVRFRPVEGLHMKYSVAPRLLVAADLIELRDPRSRGAAMELLNVLASAIHWHDARA